MGDEKDTREEAIRQWEARVEANKEALQQSNIDWSKVKLDPSQLGFRLGPMLTEAEFKAHCERTGTKPRVIKK